MPDYTFQSPGRGREAPRNQGAPRQHRMHDNRGEDMDPFGNQVNVRQLVQKKEALELCCDIEVKNNYTMQSNSGAELYLSESSECCERVCCGPNRSLTFNVHAGPNEHFPVIYKLNKAFHLAGCCFCRPKMNVVGGDNRGVGRIYDPCRCCCILDNKLYDQEDRLKWTVKGSTCQLGVCCPCGSAEFPINDASTNRRVGNVEKQSNGLAECCFAANKFQIDFPRDATVDEKALFIGSAMLIDVEYFERKKN